MSDAPRTDELALHLVQQGRDKLLAKVERLERELSAMTAERDALRADAERYRWLERNSILVWDFDYERVQILFESPVDDLSGGLMSTIDKAMKGE